MQLGDNRVFPAPNVDVHDVTGAGDVFISTLTYLHANGKDLPFSIDKAIQMATRSVQHRGTYQIQKWDIGGIMRYVIDIDGTICYPGPGEGRYIHAVPRWDRIQVINNLYDEGNYVVYLTARGMGRFDNSRRLEKNSTTSLSLN